MKVPFSKVESIGNDFVLVEAQNLQGIDPSEFAIAACKRHFAIGSDGLLVVDKAPNGDLLKRMFNPDGTEDFCGNGLRCAAVYAVERMGFPNEFTIQHGGKLIPSRITEKASDRLHWVETVLPPATFNPLAIPHTLPEPLFNSTLTLGDKNFPKASAVSTGSTHLVLQVDEWPSDETVNTLGPLLEHHPEFPERTSVIWAWQKNLHSISIRIWERGVGETQGCGTGSSAAAIVQLRMHNLSGCVEVVNPGGTVSVTAEDWESPIKIKGQARIVYDGVFEIMQN